MRTNETNLLGGLILLAMLPLSMAAIAQEAAVDDDIGPAVDTSAIPVDDDPIVEDAATEDDQILPEADVTRRTSGNRVMDEIELGRTEITGNQELPKVLYIVPWQRSDPGDLLGRPVNSLLDDVLAPIDREEFTRQVDYYNDLYGNDEK